MEEFERPGAPVIVPMCIGAFIVLAALIFLDGRRGGLPAVFRGSSVECSVISTSLDRQGAGSVLMRCARPGRLEAKADS